MQWRRLIGSAIADSDRATVCGDLYAEWDGHAPSIGQLDELQFLALADILTRHTSTADDVFFAFWESNGRFNADDGSFIPGISPARFRIGGREQVVVRGDLTAVLLVPPVPETVKISVYAGGQR